MQHALSSHDDVLHRARSALGALLDRLRAGETGAAQPELVLAAGGGKLYDEPKNLAAQGYAVATEQFTGKRRSQEYSITTEGRAALAAWLGEPSAPRTTEFEGMVKVFFADGGDLAQLRATLQQILTEADERIAALGVYASAPLPFPERAHISALTLPLQLEQERAVTRWARWAIEQVETWPDTAGPGTWDVADVLRGVARRALEDPEPAYQRSWTSSRTLPS